MPNVYFILNLKTQIFYNLVTIQSQTPVKISLVKGKERTICLMRMKMKFLKAQ